MTSTFFDEWGEGSKDSDKPSVSSPNSLVIRYTLEGKEQVDTVLTKILFLKGADTKSMSREKLEELYIDLSYYRSTLLFARKELVDVLLRKKQAFNQWLAEKRRDIRETLNLKRAIFKKNNGVKMQDITGQEIQDEILGRWGVEHDELELAVETTEENLRFLKDQMSEIAERRDQIQNILRYRFQ